MLVKNGSTSARPTLHDVAKAAGVSKTTASNAFNRPDQLSIKVRERVMAAADAIGYSGPNPMARMLRTGRAGIIGVVFPEALTYAVTDPAAITFMQGIAKACERQNAGVLILSAHDEEVAGVTVAKAAVDGFIVHCLAAEKSLIDHVLARGQPVVAVDHGSSIGPYSIDIDEYGGAYQAADHIAKLGHRRIAILSLDTSPDGYTGPLTPERRHKAVYRTTMQRLRGYEDALVANGIDLETVLIEEMPGSDQASVIEAINHVLASPAPPTALLAMSDMVALAAISAGKSRGLAVPDALSVVGFDDVPIAAQVEPPLTTVNQPLVEKGKVAATLLFERPDGQVHHVLPTRLVVRGTTAPPG